MVSASAVPVPASHLDAARDACAIPVCVGSGATAATVQDLLRVADAVIVGSDLKRDGVWWKPLDPARIAAFVRAAHGG